MLPEEFAQQYFDLWQESVGKMMQDPRFASKMAELLQRAQDGSDAAQPPRLWTTRADGPAADTVDELSRRLEECEQRIAVLEALVRHHLGSQSPARRSHSPVQRELSA